MHPNNHHNVLQIQKVSKTFQVYHSQPIPKIIIPPGSHAIPRPQHSSAPAMTHGINPRFTMLILTKDTRNVEAFLEKAAIAYRPNSRQSGQFWPYTITVFSKKTSTLRAESVIQYFSKYAKWSPFIPVLRPKIPQSEHYYTWFGTGGVQPVGGASINTLLSYRRWIIIY